MTVGPIPAAPWLLEVGTGVRAFARVHPPLEVARCVAFNHLLLRVPLRRENPFHPNSRWPLGGVGPDTYYDSKLSLRREAEEETRESRRRTRRLSRKRK